MGGPGEDLFYCPYSEVPTADDLYILIVIHTQIACEIDIRTLTSHQVWGLILDQIFDQVLGQILDQKIQCTVLLGQKKVTR